MSRCECGRCQECNWVASHGEPPDLAENNTYECPACGAPIQVPNEAMRERRVAELEVELDRLREAISEHCIPFLQKYRLQVLPNCADRVLGKKDIAYEARDAKQLEASLRDLMEDC